MGEKASKTRKWCRDIHRELSYIFSGIMLVYAASGFVLNLKTSGTFNPENDVKYRNTVLGSVPQFTQTEGELRLVNFEEVMKECRIRGEISAVYADSDSTVTVYVRGGSSIKYDRGTGTAYIKEKKNHPVLSALNTLHYNRPSWWGMFSNTFILAFVLIILTGLVMVPGKRGLKGRGGIELLIGIAIPVLFMIFF